MIINAYFIKWIYLMYISVVLFVNFIYMHFVEYSATELNMLITY